MDRNKATFKLKNIPPIYYLNLDEEPERNIFMESQLKYWEIENYTRISAYDGRGDRDLGHILKGRYPDGMSSGEVGCTTSHLKAMKEFLKTDEPCALIMEDDCDIGTVANWPFEWRDFFCKIPYDYDVIQLVVINPASIHLQMHRRFINDFSTACYLITRRHAQKLMDLHVRGDKYKLDNGVKPRAVADDLIYNSGNTFAIPLFLFRIQLGSSIHAEHIDFFHKSSYDGLWNFWKVDSINVEDWNKIFDYDPYFGRLPPGFEDK
tara:strand:+ start:3341 stop:4132 length:792 start_codon:yes stop_codon:yes gene_type:complete